MARFPKELGVFGSGSTTTTRAKWHVAANEIIKSKDQRDWTDVYNATFQLTADGKPFEFRDAHGTKRTSFRGSTLPNFKPGAGKPANWSYSVVMATCAFPSNLEAAWPDACPAWG